MSVPIYEWIPSHRVQVFLESSRTEIECYLSSCMIFRKVLVRVVLETSTGSIPLVLVITEAFLHILNHIYLNGQHQLISC